VLLLVLGIGQIFGAWEPLWRSLFGTAFPSPAGGYTCLPTCVENDGKFLSHPGEQMASFAGSKIVVWIGVPEDQSSFEIGFFDGDSGKDDAGNVGGMWVGNWDETTTETTYTLYADPLKDGVGNQVVKVWHGNQDPMPNNAWFNDTINTGLEAQSPSGHYFYRLECTRPASGWGINAFKLRSTGYLTTGRSDLVDASFAIVGMIANPNDVRIIYPDFAGDYNNPGRSTYDAEWTFHFYIPESAVTLEIWDGDFDRGTSVLEAADTDDPNTSGKPPWASPYAVDERAGGGGVPADDFSWAIWRRDPPVWYEVIDPAGDPIYTNDNPSGTEEWERFVISTDATINADRSASSILPGLYTWHIVGLDAHNTVWIRTSFEICPPDECGPDECEATCPRTIGYWKNNVRKVLIEGKTGGVQESRESLEKALDAVAAASPLFRHGINVSAPVAIDAPVRLTDQEADAILQKEAGNTMLDRALQQNLATWLNMMSGKICKDTQVVINVPGGTFEGTVWEALQAAQDIILNGGDLEWAKDIADMINNVEINVDPDELSCDAYVEIIPPEKQPKPAKDVPKGPKPPKPPEPVVTCDSPRVTQYGVQVTNNPFDGIKFEFQSGPEIKDGAVDGFDVTLPADQAAGLSSVQLEAKAGENVGIATLEGCQFDGFTPCDTAVQDGNGFFTFSFLGAIDNGDGTLTLTFVVQNHTGNGLSHTTIGVVPPSPPGSYQSEYCP
jgi:hypothetical protein